MFTTRSPSPKAPATEPSESGRKRLPLRLYLLLYPFTALAVAINLFMLALMWQTVGLPALAPVTALLLCVPLGIPANLWVTRWVQGLMDEADSG